MVISDNGASAEGGVTGSFNEMRFFNQVPESFEDNLAHIDDLGGAGGLQPLSVGLGNALQVAVFKLRRTVGADVIVTRPPGYSLSVVPEDVDAVRFERLVQDGRAALGGGSSRHRDWLLRRGARTVAW